MSESNDAKWYVIHTYSGYENKVASSLQQIVDNRSIQDLIQEIKVPTEKVIEYTEVTKKPHEVERKIFPGYVLVKMVLTDDTWYIVRNTRGCTGFVGPESNPVPLTDEEIDRMGVEEHKIELPYDIGDSVKIVNGANKAMIGFVGTVTDIDVARKRIKMLVSMFGQDTTVDLDFDNVLPVG